MNFRDEPPWPEGSNVTPLAVKARDDAEPPFPYTWVARAELNLDTKPILKGLIELGAFVMIYGPSGSGKSFFAADIAQHIAMGMPWRGRKVERGLVVYVASEAGSSILRRFIGWRDHRLSDAAQGDPMPLGVLTRGPNLLASVEVEKLVETLTAMQEEAGFPLVMVIFDTLSRSMHGGDENTAEDMTMAVNAADVIRAKFGAATVFVHHSGKDPSKGARGHSALFAAADVVLSVESRTATLEKVRDGVTGERFSFSLEPVELGLDADGDPVMTCLLTADDFATPPKRKEPVGKNQRIVLKEMRTLAIDAEASPGTSEIPKGAPIVRFEDLVEKSTPRFAGMEPFRARARIAEAVSSLQACGFVGVHGQLVWLL